VSRGTRLVAVAAGLFFVVLGLWAFFDPRSFYQRIASYPPYNEHLFHDLGAFQIGIGAALLLALKWRDALFVALAAAGIGSGVHALAHWLDRDLGGRSSDPWAVTLLAVVVLWAASERRNSS
jgi:hypothetical protein